MASTISTRRKTERLKCAVEARVYSAGRPSVDCSIWDITTDGARLIAREDIPTNGRIFVFISSIGEVWAAEVRWKRGRVFGVRFIRGEADLVDRSDAPRADAFALRLQIAQVAATANRRSDAVSIDSKPVPKGADDSAVNCFVGSGP